MLNSTTDTDTTTTTSSINTTILDLCDSLLGNLLCNNNNNNDDWKKKMRTNPTKVLALAIDSMSKDQRNFYNLIINNDNNNDEQQQQIYMLAGLPGTGKSFLQTVINPYFQLQGKTILCLAPTNLIAYQQKGTTIHKKIDSICTALEIKRFNCDTLFIEKLIKNNYNNINDMSLTELCQCISKLLLQKHTVFIPLIPSENIIIFIDEGTMVSSTLFSLLYFSFPKSKYIITYGPNQLPPPNGGTSCDTCISKEESNRVLFYELVSQMRFNSSFMEFVKYFSDVLSQKTTIETTTTLEKLDKLEYFLKNVKIGGSLQDYHQNLKKNSDRILIVSTNAQRCKENAQRLKDEGEGPIFSIPTEMDPRLPPYYDTTSRLGIDKVLKIRKGVYCMIRVNELSRNLIKGQIVKITDIIEDKEKGDVVKIKAVRIDDGKLLSLQKMIIQTDYFLVDSKKKGEKKEEEEEEEEKREAQEPLTIKQFPITLSYSLTAHSAQGKTLNCNVGIELQHYDNVIPINSYFVAITRVRDAKQLYMNVHPVYWLYYPFMKIKSLEDVVEMRKKYNAKTTTTTNVIQYVNDFQIKNPLPLRNVNDMIKKICNMK